jgi:hypothetical protein
MLVWVHTVGCTTCGDMVLHVRLCYRLICVNDVDGLIYTTSRLYNEHVKVAHRPLGQPMSQRLRHRTPENQGGGVYRWVAGRATIHSGQGTLGWVGENNAPCIALCAADGLQQRQGGKNY